MNKLLPILLAITFSSGSVNTRGFNDKPFISLPSIAGKTSYVYSGGMSKSSINPHIGVSLPPTESSSSSSSSNSSSSQEPEEPSLDYFYCEAYGPFSSKEQEDVEMTFTYSAEVSASIFCERVRLFKNGEAVFASKKASFTYLAGTKRDVTFMINVYDYISEDGLELRFELLATSYSIVVRSYGVTFYPPKEEHLLANQLKYYPYESRCVGFYGDGEKMCELKDILDFAKFGDYVDNDYYYRLDIGRNYFYFSNTYWPTMDSAYLRFYDDEYLFPNVSHEQNDEIILPLKIRKQANKLSLQFKDKYYVNRKTLDVSDTYRPDYVVSSSFYLPINSHSKFNGKTIYVEINGFGLNKISTTLTLKYEFNRLIVGSCSNGEYCVHGGAN